MDRKDKTRQIKRINTLKLYSSSPIYTSLSIPKFEMDLKNKLSNIKKLMNSAKPEKIN